MSDYNDSYSITKFTSAYRLPVIKETGGNFRLEEAQKIAVANNIPVVRDNERFAQIVVPDFKYYFIDKGKDPRIGYNTIAAEYKKNANPKEEFDLAKRTDKPVVRTNRLDGSKEVYMPSGDMFIIKTND